MCNAAIAEGQQLDEFPALPTTVTHEQRSPIDITGAANQLVDEQVAAYNAKLRVFRTFCAHFNEAAKEFTTGPERDFAKHFSTLPPRPPPLRLELPPQTLPITHHKNLLPLIAKGNDHRCPPHLEKTSGVFVRLEADAPARNHIGYAIRAHVASKTGLELNRIPQVLQVNTGWAIRAADKLTRDLLVERQAEWADDLGATAVETSQKWYTYAVDNCPRRLTDLYGNELNYDAAVRDEINNQTGLTPVSIRVPRRDNEQLPKRHSSYPSLNRQKDLGVYLAPAD
ncbi:hypothetical protein VCV18_011357 [Metarhizium anisopliae]